MFLQPCFLSVRAMTSSGAYYVQTHFMFVAMLLVSTEFDCLIPSYSTAPPRFTSKIPPSITIREGAKLSLNISASGNPPPKITWSLQGRNHGNQSRFKLTDETFEIMEVRFEDQGMITCQAENVFGTRVTQVKLIVFGEFCFFFSCFQES